MTIPICKLGRDITHDQQNYIYSSRRDGGRRTDDDEIRLVDHGIPIRTVATVSRELLLFLLVAAIERVPVVHVPELLPDTVTWPEEKKKTIHLCAIIYECINDSAINRRRLSRRILSYNDKMTFIEEKLQKKLIRS